MNARYPYLFALALALPLASCRFVGMKPDFSVMGDALTPAEPDSVCVESTPTAATPLPGYQPPPARPLPRAEKRESLFTQQQQQPSAAAQPQPASPARHAATPPATATSALYTVLPGDTLSRIARAHRVPLGSLAAANGIDLQKPIIKPGQQLRIPQGGAAVIAPPLSASAPPPAATPAPALTLKPVAAPAATRSQSSYRVCPGDTLYRIALRHRVSLQQLMQANNITPETAHKVQVGTLLIIPSQP